MTINRIKEVALNQFAKSGYEGASMAHIANEVGIKKQSIYTHFKGKDELFLQVCRDTFTDELSFVHSFMNNKNKLPLEDLLFGLLLEYKKRYEQNIKTKFWLRVSFFPPAHLYDHIINDVYHYLDQLEELLIPIFDWAMSEGSINASVGVKRAATAYLSLLDGIFVEMLYGGKERLEKRLDASWHLYWRGLTID